MSMAAVNGPMLGRSRTARHVPCDGVHYWWGRSHGRRTRCTCPWPRATADNRPVERRMWRRDWGIS